MTETKICDHAGWGSYAGETGACPPPTELIEIDGGVECQTCGFHVRTLSARDAMDRVFALNRETATIDRETR